jgi:hypothetical protein
MKRLFDYEVSDAHVHSGTCSLLGVTVSLSELQKHISQTKLSLVFPLDVDLTEHNRALIRLVEKIENAYGLFRIQLDSLNYHWTTLETALNQTDKILGVKLHPTFDRVPVTHAEFDPIFNRLEEDGLIALVHCGRWVEVSGSHHAIERAIEYPDITFILAHMGGNELDLSLKTITAVEALENIYLDTSNCRVPTVIEKAVETLGPDRVLFGSDTPWGSSLSNAYTIVDANIDDRDKRLILSENLENLIERHKASRAVTLKTFEKVRPLENVYLNTGDYPLPQVIEDGGVQSSGGM